MEDFKNNSSQNLGIAALITAIITFVIAVIPCVGIIAIVPGIIAIILGTVGLSQASRSNSPKGVQIAGIIIASIACIMAISQIFFVGKFADKVGRHWPDNIQNIVEDVQDNVIKDLEDANVNIKIESNGDKVEINARTNNKEQEKVLEGLEGDSLPKDTTQTGIKPKSK
jgi:hypothetical protein